MRDQGQPCAVILPTVSSELGLEGHWSLVKQNRKFWLVSGSCVEGQEVSFLRFIFPNVLCRLGEPLPTEVV